MVPCALLWPPNATPDCPPAMSLLRVPVCDEHGKDFTGKPLEQIIPRFREMVTAGLRRDGKCEPDWTRTKVELLPVEEGLKPFHRPENN